ncbi:N-acetylneuraminate 9-O-acetyltransferase isoform X2 [Thrips palmi]|uniref:N-acetylneuraminate 9-O-acetyltransferase isoform X2 n=1 Tax=Thrips palmi TaxID=161013 RepID=A0A6P8ZYG4_THRPL|nr:N-acetylneuraminate 9-O-acetyltransferase isoform X2 [Thrips palmi]
MTGKGEDEGTAANVIKQINAKNAKIVACLVVIGFCFYHGILHVRYGIDSCKWLLSDGRYKGNMEWQPYGCMMHQYSLKDTRRCFRYLTFLGKRNHFAFIGDTQVQLHYRALLHQLAGHKQSEASFWANAKSNQTLDALPQSDHAFHDSLLGLHLEYLWQPFLTDNMTNRVRSWMEKGGPSVIVIGMGSWAIKSPDNFEHSINEFTVNLTRFAKTVLPKGEHKSIVLWVPIPPIKESKQLLTPDDPFNNEHIDLFNKAAIEVLEHSGAQVWWSSRLLSQGRIDESFGEAYPGYRALSLNTQILLNAYCNDHMNFNDGTCCWSAEPYTYLQVATYASFAVCIVIAFTMVLYRISKGSYHQTHVKYTPLPKSFEMGGNETVECKPDASLDILPLLFALSKLGLIMIFFYVCDRTSFFMKENKYYSPLSFWLPLAYMVVLGLFFTEDSRYTKVLHREQTDEWKGWMQLAVLIYQMTDASGILPIYMHARVLVSAYLFLSGYGHFSYFWQRGEAGIVRFFQIIFRLNFLTVVLCLAMNRPYQFYHFIPLISWWVFAVFLFLSFPPRVSAMSSDGNPLQFLTLVLKFVGFISIITILYMSEVFFEKVFVTRPWKALFVTTDDDIHEWWFRWKLNRYSVSYGMIYAVGLFLAQRHQLLDDRNHSNLLSPRLSFFAALMSLCGIGGYLGFSILCRNRQECNEVHPYIVFIPIISYIALRNISGILRTRYSTFFAWFGKISLELSVCQYHIWLAADANGVLVLVPGSPALNAIVTSFIFVCVAHEAHEITKVLLPYVVPSDWRKVLRNAVVFTLVLIPIGIHDGMF